MSVRYIDSFDGSKDEMYPMMDVTQPHFDNPYPFTLPRLTTTIVDSSPLCDSPVGLTASSTFSPSVSPFTPRGSSDYFTHSPYSNTSICGHFSDSADLSPPEKKRCTSAQTNANRKSGRKGNNQFGRSGKPRCQQCRTWRQKCVYESLDQPCTNCDRRHVPCGAEDKTFGKRREFLIKSASGSSTDTQLVHIGRKRSLEDDDDMEFILRLPRADSDNPFSAMDASYVDYYRKILFPEYVEERGRKDGRHLSDCIVHRFGDHLSSKAFRYAVLLYAYCFKELESIDMSQIYQYYGLYCKYTQEAISQGSYAEAAYASHTVCMAGFVSGLLDFEDISWHAEGFLLSFAELISEGKLPSEERFLLRCMCKDIFCWLTSTVGSQREVHVERSPARATKLFKLVQLTIPLFRNDDRPISEVPEWMQKAQGYLQVQMLMYRLQISFDLYFVKQMDQQENPKSASAEALESLATTIKLAAVDLNEILSKQPQLRTLIGDSQFFPFHEQGSFGPSKETNDYEWMNWKPSILAHYKSQFESFFSLDPTPKENSKIDFAAVEAGMSICRIIDCDQDKSSLFEMNSLTALRSLFITGVLLTESESPDEGTNLRKELKQFFNLDEYIQIRLTQSPLLKPSHRFHRPATKIQALREDMGGFLDCRGRLRDDKSVACPSCGRLTCDALDILELNSK